MSVEAPSSKELRACMHDEHDEIRNDIAELKLDMNDKISKIEKSFDQKLLSKVGWKQFYIMVSFLVALFIGIAGLLYANQKETITTMYTLFERQDNKIDKVRDTVGTTQQDVSLMKGILKNAEISN